MAEGETLACPHCGEFLAAIVPVTLTRQMIIERLMEISESETPRADAEELIQDIAGGGADPAPLDVQVAAWKAVANQFRNTNRGLRLAIDDLRHIAEQMRFFADANKPAPVESLQAWASRLSLIEPPPLTVADACPHCGAHQLYTATDENIKCRACGWG